MTPIATTPPASVFGPAIDEMFERLQDLDGKAEIVDGGIFVMSLTGVWPSLVALEIAFALREHARSTGIGHALGDNVIFRVQLPHRQSFSPDAAFVMRPISGMGPIDGAPDFAVEVRSIGDYGPRAEQLMAEKREDYFACGTRVVWDVDLTSTDVVRSYRSDAPQTPNVFSAREIAHAEPAVAGWRVEVAQLLPADWLPSSSP